MYTAKAIHRLLFYYSSTKFGKETRRVFEVSAYYKVLSNVQGRVWHSFDDLSNLSLSFSLKVIYNQISSTKRRKSRGKGSQGFSLPFQSLETDVHAHLRSTPAAKFFTNMRR